MKDYLAELYQLHDVKSFDELSKEQIKVLNECMHHHDSEVRFEIAALIGRLEPSENTVKRLKQLIWDKDELVASEACEAMRVVGDESCIDALLKRLNARSAMVRGYAVISAADLCTIYDQKAEKMKQLVLERMKQEKEQWVLLDYHCAMYLLGETAHLVHLLKGLVSKNYLIRASTVSLIKDFVFDDDQSISTVRAYASKHMDKTSREYAELIKVL